MIAVEIKVNGEVAAICGTEDLQQLLGVVAARTKDDEPFHYVVEVMGLRHSSDGHHMAAKWKSIRIELGDVVSFKFIEAAGAEGPVLEYEVPPPPNGNG